MNLHIDGWLWIKQKPPNTVCTWFGVRGVLLRILRGLKLVPSKRRPLVPPTRPLQGVGATGNVNRWAAHFYRR